MEISDELAALEFDFRSTLIAELTRVAKTGDDRFFAFDQPARRSGGPTLKALADEILDLRTKMKPPVTNCLAAEFLGYCIRWNLPSARARLSSAELARELLERVQREADG